MSWHAELELDYRLQSGRSVVRHRHSGPLRVLQSLYPEGDAICHNVLVHPPGGLVGGDTLELDIRVDTGAHALLTTPGATRFYRSTQAPARQRTRLRLANGARAEWLPLEALCFNGCLAENRLLMELEHGAELLGWDLCALGLPHAGQPFAQGSFLQHLEVPGLWLERARIDAADSRLRDSPLGLAGKRCLGTLFFVAGAPLEAQRRQQALDLARELIAAHPLARWVGATSPNHRLLLLRLLGQEVEPSLGLLRSVWSAWRSHFWQLAGASPRIWAT